MAKDFKVTDYGDLYIDPETHDFVIIDGVEEVTQRIKATLEIFYREMEVLDPEMGMDYTYFLGKRFNKQIAESELIETITSKVPEVDNVDNIEFNLNKATRHLDAHFECTVTPSETNQAEQTEGDVSIGI